MTPHCKARHNRVVHLQSYLVTHAPSINHAFDQTSEGDPVTRCLGSSSGCFNKLGHRGSGVASDGSRFILPPAFKHYTDAELCPEIGLPGAQWAAIIK